MSALEEGELEATNQVANRITDIDREIAECQERLVRMSSSNINEGEEAIVPTEQPAIADTAMFEAIAANVHNEPHLAVPHIKSAISDNEDNAEEEDEDEDSLAAVYPPKDKMQSMISGIYAENNQRAAQLQSSLSQPFLLAHPSFVPGSYPQPQDWPFWDHNVTIHERIRPHLALMLGKEKQQQARHSQKLQREYSDLYNKWRKRVDKLDKQREAKQRALSAVAAASGGNGGSATPTSGGSASGTFAGGTHRRRLGSNVAPSLLVADEFGFSLGPLVTASVSSMDGHKLDDMSLFTSDAVNSEAELQAIIERLQYDDSRNPDIRSQRTAAEIPNMVTDHKEREQLRFNNNSHLVEDPLTFYHVRLPEESRRIVYNNNADAEQYWTQNEASAFVAAYLAHPKEFGKIAACIPNKSMNDCVQFYYRNKKQLRLKELEAKTNKRLRRSRQTSSTALSSGGMSRKRKERARERRERKAKEVREKMAMEAAAGCAPDEIISKCGSALPSDEEEANTTTGLSAEAADILERRSKGSALLIRSIITSRRGTALPTEDQQSSSVATPMTERGDEIEDMEEDDQQQKKKRPKAVDEVDEEEEGELVEEEDDSKWTPRRKSRQKSELNAYAMGGSIVRTRRSLQAEQQFSDNESSAAESEEEEDDDEIIEASGVVAADRRRPSLPRVVSRKSQSRFSAVLTTTLEDPAEQERRESVVSRDSNTGSVPPPGESAQDKFVVASETTASIMLHGPISSYDTLMICSNKSSASSSTEQSLQPHRAGGSSLSNQQLDAMVEEHAGVQDSVLVGAAVWLRDDRRRVLRGFHRLGPDFTQVASLMPSKTMPQCRYFYYRYRTPAGKLLSDIIPGNNTTHQPLAAQTTSIAEPVPQRSRVSSLVLPPQGAAIPNTIATGAMSSSSEDEEDETPLAAQLAEELAAAGKGKNPILSPTTPLSAPILTSSTEGTHQPAPEVAAVVGASISAKKSGYSSYWSVHERSVFIQNLAELGQDWQALAKAVGTKTPTQVRNFYRANREKLQLDSAEARQSLVLAGANKKEKRGRKRRCEVPVTISATSAGNTAPATMTTFPTMGVDGGRAVVYARPPPAPLPSIRAVPPTSQPQSYPPAVVHNSNPVPQTDRKGKQTEEAREEPARKVNVTRINALLNDEPIEATQAPPSSKDWFGETTPPQKNEEEATGIAALALASMMESGKQQRYRLPPPHPQSATVPPHMQHRHSHFATSTAVVSSSARPSSVEPSASVNDIYYRQRKPSAPPPATHYHYGQQQQSPPVYPPMRYPGYYQQQPPPPSQ